MAKKSSKTGSKEYRMYNDEIEAAKKRLGTYDSKETPKKDILCSKNNCGNPATSLCPHCNGYFCDKHITPTITMPHPSSWPNNDPLLLKLYREEWKKADAHVCAPYAAIKLEEIKTEKNPAVTRWGAGEPPHYKQSQPTSFRSQYRARKLKFSFDRALISKAAIITIAILLLSYIGFIHTESLQINFASLAAAAFVLDLVIVFFVTLIFDYSTAHRKFATQELYGAIFSTITITMFATFNASSVSTMAVFALSVFIALYAGYWISNRKKIRKVMQFFGILFLLLVIIESLGLATTTSGNSPSANPTNTLANSLSSAINKVNSAVNNMSSSINPPINSSWANEFFANVSTQRGAPYYYCPVLSEFARTRFHTMAANYGISHYGYNQDFNTYWPGGYASGPYIYTAFGEEVFYPSGYTPRAYVSQVISTAPGHWQELSNTSLTYYGFYIARGPAYEILGPGGGYGEACPVTEIPGPNINISQFFAQYGCSVELSNLTYFVIEIASVCPQTT